MTLPVPSLTSILCISAAHILPREPEFRRYVADTAVTIYCVISEDKPAMRFIPSSLLSPMRASATHISAPLNNDSTYGLLLPTRGLQYDGGFLFPPALPAASAMSLLRHYPGNAEPSRSRASPAPPKMHHLSISFRGPTLFTPAYFFLPTFPLWSIVIPCKRTFQT